MVSQLEKLDLPYCFIEAVDKNALSDRHYALYDDGAVRKRVGRSLSKGEIACAHSHAETWKLAIRQNIDYAIILEDDAELGPDFSETIYNLPLFPQDWDMLNFCTTAPQEPVDKILPNGLKVGRIPRKMGGAVAYCATRKGLKIMLEHVYPFRAAVDGLLSSLAIVKLLKCYGTLPQVVRPSPEFTSAIWQEQSQREKRYYISDCYTHRRKKIQHIAENVEVAAKYQREVYRKARELYQSGEVLDIGCGAGDKIAEFFPSNVTLGLDLASVISVAKTRHPCRRWRLSNFNQPPKGKFTLVVCANVIEQIFDPDELLDFIEKIDFDTFLISTPDRDTLKRRKTGPPHNQMHYREWNQTEFRSYIGERFEVMNQYYCEEPGYFSQVIEFTKMP